MLERPTGSARLKDNCIATQFINTNLHRRSRAETGIEKYQSNGSPAEQVGACIGMLQFQRPINESFKLLARPLAGRQKMFLHTQTRAPFVRTSRPPVALPCRA